ncbi:GNAT family N-acetyltransferase [Streptomyces sp. HPF1205]|uniref:GNAT family N-acetyltransferase n=1 Tax=Streptomyces sp. HPF1205 TaxID=2873262 RepID=UPI001CEC1055|nr:GNAT family N-acetyltransferase [Streptomyces sp. HPF1205]
MTVEIRTLDESDVADWLRALHAGFLISPSVTEEEVAVRRPSFDLARTRGAFDGGRCVGTFRSMQRELTVPGGAVVAASAVTNVCVLGTHRRRGLLSRMMAADLAEAKERGEAVSILIAAEHPIYGRYGFGPATWVGEWEIDVMRAAQDKRYGGPADGGRVDQVTVAEVRKTGPALFDRVRAVTNGAIDRPPFWWELATGERVPPSRPWKEPFFAVYRDAAGRADGLVAYDVDDHEWPNKLSRTEVKVRQLVAATPAAEAALWQYLISLDWVTQVRTNLRAPDDVVPLLLGDPRAARPVTYADFMWLRVLDVPAALSARTYSGTGPVALVLDVADPDGMSGGRFLLETDVSGAAVCGPAPAGASPDLTVPLPELGRLYLGDESPVRLAALGRLTEHRAGAARTADALFRTPRRPWCPDFF